MTLYPLLLLQLLLLHLCLPSAPASGKWSFNSQSELDAWWRSATRLRTTETAYEVRDLGFQDGVCAARFEEGLFIPVRSGVRPVSDRVVGVIFLGKGSLSLSFPDRADAWAFANHMVLFASADRASMRRIAHQEEPFKVGISRALILGADPIVERLLLELQPTRSGAVYSETPEGVDEVYVVTEGRSALGARVAATNILPDRRRLLDLDGMDPVAMIREDRLLIEELGLLPEDMRVIADYQTDTNFRVGAREGRVVGPQAWDRWMTCFRDGLGRTNSGYRSIAFAHGLDQGNQRRFQRFSGERWELGPEDQAPQPRVWMEPLRAEIEAEVKPANFFSNFLKARVNSVLTLRAHGAALRPVVLSVPAGHAVRGSWNLDKLELEDGTPVPWVALAADLWGQSLRGTGTSDGKGVQQEALAAPEGSSDTTSSSTTGALEITSPEASTLSVTGTGLAEAREGRLLKDTPRRWEIIALLPQAVPEGGELRLRMNWSARWQYANWSSMGRPLGPTTGLQPLLPDLLPSPGGTRWDFSLLAGVPGASLRTYDLAASGDTVRSWENLDGDGWKWVETRGSLARNVSIALGQWHDIADVPAMGLPGVRAHLFFANDGALSMFPPEIRRVVTFLDRFLPDFPAGEVEVFQGASGFVGDALQGGFRGSANGLVAVQTIKSTEVGETSGIAKEDPNLMRSMIVRQVASQVLGQRISPATGRDQWLMNSLSDAFAAFYIRTAVGRKDYDARVVALRKAIEDPKEWAENFKQVNDRMRFLSLSGSTGWTELPPKVLADYGAYVVAEMLRPLVGDEHFFRSLDRLATERQGGWMSTEAFQESLEITSGRDLDDTFDFWIHGGFVPALELQVREGDPSKGGALHGCVVADIPFGRFEVPVQVVAKGGGRVVAGPVQVVDGLGSFTIEDWKGEPIVELDPDRRILAYARKIRSLARDARSDCEKAARPEGS